MLLLAAQRQQHPGAGEPAERHQSVKSGSRGIIGSGAKGGGRRQPGGRAARAAVAHIRQGGLAHVCLAVTPRLPCFDSAKLSSPLLP
jgi:hypothetical protein